MYLNKKNYDRFGRLGTPMREAHKIRWTTVRHPVNLTELRGSLDGDGDDLIHLHGFLLYGAINSLVTNEVPRTYTLVLSLSS